MPEEATACGADPYGVRIKVWSCPISWHRYVKWHGMDAYCIEPGCSKSNIPDGERSGR